MRIRSPLRRRLDSISATVSRKRFWIPLVGLCLVLDIAGLVICLVTWFTPRPVEPVSWENYRRIKNGMTIEEVESILGPPTISGGGRIPGTSGWVGYCCWNGPDGWIDITFSAGPPGQPVKSTVIQKNAHLERSLIEDFRAWVGF